MKSSVLYNKNGPNFEYLFGNRYDSFSNITCKSGGNKAYLDKIYGLNQLYWTFQSLSCMYCISFGVAVEMRGNLSMGIPCVGED